MEEKKNWVFGWKRKKWIFITIYVFDCRLLWYCLNRLHSDMRTSSWILNDFSPAENWKHCLCMAHHFNVYTTHSYRCYDFSHFEKFQYYLLFLFISRLYISKVAAFVAILCVNILITFSCVCCTFYKLCDQSNLNKVYFVSLNRCRQVTRCWINHILNE